MAKDISMCNDISPDAGAVNGGAGTDCGGDLADNKGVDLNAGAGSVENSEPEMSKHSLGTKLGILGGAFAIPGVAVAGTGMPNEHVQGIINEPTAGYHQVYERPHDSTWDMIEQGAGPANESEVIENPLEPVAGASPPDEE